MIKFILTKLKIVFKRLLGKIVYGYVYVKDSLKTLVTSTPQNQTHRRRRHKKSILNIISAIVIRWKLSSVIAVAFFIIYYGIGAGISANIYKPMTTDLKLNSQTVRHIPLALSYVLKTQLDDSQWAPALPIIFPASILDNLPNFQLGVKDSSKYIIHRLANFKSDSTLKKASELLNYPSDIWLFSQTVDGKLAPGSAKQYRKALALITEYNTQKENFSTVTPQELLYQLNSLNNILSRQIKNLHRHYREHNNDLIDLKADNIFYRAQGNIFTVYYVLDALSKDYQNFIISAGQYENLTSALTLLKEAETISPMMIKNNSVSDTWGGNHLLYLAYYISRSQNYIQQIKINIKQYIKE